ncbi:hypothetical protein ACOSQ4_011214 [Xanthoceras sorbifolium]
MALFIILILSLPIFIFLIIQIRRRATDSTTSVHLLPGPRVVSSAKMAKEVMKTHDLEFCSRLALLGQQKLSYNGLDLCATPFNDYYREMRKLCVAHLFNLNRVQQYRPIREDEVSRMIKKISKSAAAVATKLVNLSELIIGFGKRYEDEGVERSLFHVLLNETQAMFRIFFFLAFLPFMGWVDKLTGLISRIKKNFKEFDAFYQKLINEHLDPKRPKSNQEDIIDYPRVMIKVQEEVRNLIGGKGFVDEDDVQKLPYLEAVIKETMRLQPTIPLLVPRETTKKCILNGHEIPSKTLVFVNAFSGSSIDMKGQHFELIPFGAGRRICQGLHMGIAIVELALANLLYKFNWEMPVGFKQEDLDFDVIQGVTMHKKNVLRLMVKNMDI